MNASCAKVRISKQKHKSIYNFSYIDTKYEKNCYLEGDSSTYSGVRL